MSMSSGRTLNTFRGSQETLSWQISWHARCAFFYPIFILSNQGKHRINISGVFPFAPNSSERAFLNLLSYLVVCNIFQACVILNSTKRHRIKYWNTKDD